MKSPYLSAALVVMVIAAGSTAGAQSSGPGAPAPSPQPIAPPRQAQALSRPPPTGSASLPGPINATGTSAAYVSAESTGNPAVFIGSDVSGYGIMGTFTNHPLGFRTNNIARMLIDTSGNVGIGTLGPGYRLDVSGDANITGTYRVNGVPISATSNWTQAGNNVYYTTGNVGIGVIDPLAARLQVVDGGNGIAVYGTSTSDNGSGVFGYGSNGTGVTGSGSIFGVSGSSNSFTGTGVYGTGGSFGVNGASASGTGVYGTGGSFGVNGVSTSGSGVYGTSTSSSGVYGYSGSTGVTGQGGSWGVTGTSDSGIGVYGTSTSGIGVQGYSSFNYAAYFTGDVYVTATLTQHSDVRLKQNVLDINHGLPDVLRLRPVSFTWKSKPDGPVQLGLIAQEVEAVVPELVTTGKDADQTKGINYIGLIPIMIRAMQEQQETIAALKAENARLDARLTGLEQNLHDMRGLPERDGPGVTRR